MTARLKPEDETVRLRVAVAGMPVDDFAALLEWAEERWPGAMVRAGADGLTEVITLGADT